MPSEADVAKPKLYKWDDNKGRVHTRPQRTSAQLGAAKQRQADNSTAYLGAPMTIGQINQTAQQQANTQYAPQEQALALTQQRVDPWFDRYVAQVQGLNQNVVQPAYNQAIQQQQANAQATAQPLGLSGDAGATDAEAAKAREALINFGVAQLQNAQTAQNTYSAGQQGVAEAARTGAKFTLGQQAQGLAAQKGQAVAQNRTSLIGQERQYGLGLQHQRAENAAFGVTAAKAQSQITNENARTRISRRNQSLAGKKFKSQQEKDAYERAHGLGPYKTSSGKPRFTPEQVSKANIDLRKAVELIRGEMGPNQSAEARGGPAPSSPEFWKKAYQALVTNKDMDPAIARAAVQLVRLGRVGPNTRQTLAADYGITKFPRGKRRKQPKPTTVNRPSNAPSGQSEGSGNATYRPT
jgi:hypothetical protein